MIIITVAGKAGPQPQAVASSFSVSKEVGAEATELALAIVKLAFAA